MRIIPANTESALEAARVLQEGGIVAYPTETVYGLGVNPFNASALERLYQAKGRAETNPVLLIVADRDQLAPLVPEIGKEARACMEAFWPGPLSLLLPRAMGIPDALTGGTEWICVRCPGASFAREMCRAFGGAITSTSANRSGEPPAMTASEASLPGVSLVIDGGALKSGTPSTIVNPQTGEILRQGAIPAEAVLDVLNKA